MTHRLNGPLVALYLSEIMETTGKGWDRRSTIDGIPVHQDDAKRYRTWKAGENHPTIFRLDRFLTRYGYHVNEFFAWCDWSDPWLDGLPWYELVAA